MKSPSILRCCLVVTSLLLAVPVLTAQNSFQLFGPVNVRPSANGTGYGANAVAFNSTTLNMTCGASPITATLSSTADNMGNVLVDNNITVAVTSAATTGSAVNVCSGGTSDSTPDGPSPNCFTSAYQGPASGGSLNGVDPDTLVTTGGVTPIDISGNLQSGPVQVTINEVDTGVVLAASTLYLNTNCSKTGVTGPAEITGNPIPQSNPTPQQLTQTFPFNLTTNQQVQFIYDLSQAQAAGTLTITDGTIPGTSDMPIDPGTFLSTYVPNTSFATSSCLIHTGELLPSDAQACKMYTLECTIGSGSNESGAQCPVSSLPNEIFQAIFDGPSFTLPDIPTPNGPTFHTGVGFLMAAENWTGGPCTFDPASGLQDLACPQNLLASFSGPGVYDLTGKTSHPNSAFIPVIQVPEDLTAVTVTGEQTGNWVNTSTPSLTLSSQPPNLAGTSLPGAARFVPSPIQSITYGISAPNAVPVPAYPASTDTVVPNPAGCPTPSAPSEPSATVFTTPQQTLSDLPNGNPLADGYYVLHYYAQDCAGTEELQFTQGAGASWSTSYYTVPINIDTVPPVVSSGPVLSPLPGVSGSYTVGESVTATYSCTDSLSGVVRCGASTFSPGTPSTGPIKSFVDTSAPGTKTYTVTAIDAAGNQSSASVQYSVIATSPVPPSSTKCNGTYTGTFRGNLTISAGQTCVFVSGGATGNVTNNGGSLTLSNSRVGGNLAENKGSLSLSNSSTGGNLQIGGGSFTISPGSIIGGNLQIQGLPSGMGQNQVCGSVVRGNLQSQQNGTPVAIGTPSCTGNTVGGNLQVQSNTGATAIGGNTVFGNLQDNSNRGATQVFSNVIGGSLQCQNNSSITGGGNKARLKQGQCATF